MYKRILGRAVRTLKKSVPTQNLFLLGIYNKTILCCSFCLVLAFFVLRVPVPVLVFNLSPGSGFTALIWALKSLYNFFFVRSLSINKLFVAALTLTQPPENYVTHIVNYTIFVIRHTHAASETWLHCSYPFTNKFQSSKIRFLHI